MSVLENPMEYREQVRSMLSLGERGEPEWAYKSSPIDLDLWRMIASRHHSASWMT